MNAYFTDHNKPEEGYGRKMHIGSSPNEILCGRKITKASSVWWEDLFDSFDSWVNQPDPGRNICQKCKSIYNKKLETMTLEQLIECYKRMLFTVENMLDVTPTNELIKRERLKTKVAEYRAFLSDLEKLKPEPLDTYTCELERGDDVETLSKWVGLVVGKNNEGDYLVYDDYDGHVIPFTRSKIKLIHRNGATIKEVGNDTIIPSP